MLVCKLCIAEHILSFKHKYCKHQNTSRMTFPPQYVCLQDVAQEPLDQTANPGADASTVVAVTSGQGLVSVVLALLELTAAQVKLRTAARLCTRT